MTDLFDCALATGIVVFPQYLVKQKCCSHINRAVGTKGGVMEFSVSTDADYQFADAIMGTMGVIEIALPKDQYAHVGALIEWWWHVGTLQTASGRKFGFEINALGVNGGATLSYASVQIAISDVQNQVHYQIDQNQSPLPTDWACYDPSQPWFVNLTAPGPDPNNGRISMSAINENPLAMAVKAGFTDAATQI